MAATINTFGGALFRTGPTLRELSNLTVDGVGVGDLVTYDAASNIWTNKTINESSVVKFVGTRITQTSHGFSIMDQVYQKTDGDWALAKGDARATLRQACVYSVTDADNFVVAFTGVVTITSHGFTVGATYYLSSSVAGSVTVTPVFSDIYYNQPVFTVLDSNTLKIHEQFGNTNAWAILAALPSPSVGNDIQPALASASKVFFNIGTFNNDGVSPYAEMIHFNTAPNSSYGDQNLLAISKVSGSGAMRLFAGTFGSSSSYSAYRNFIATDESANYFMFNDAIQFNSTLGEHVLRLGYKAGTSTNGEPTIFPGSAYSLNYHAHYDGVYASQMRFSFRSQRYGSLRYICRFTYFGPYKTGADTWGTLSDRSIKFDIRNISEPLTKIRKLKPKTFEYKPELQIQGKKNGFIAQDVETVFPGHVKSVTDAYGLKGTFKTLTPEFMPYLVGAMQQLTTIMQQQTGVIQNQTTELATIQVMYDQSLLRIQKLETM